MPCLVQGRSGDIARALPSTGIPLSYMAAYRPSSPRNSEASAASRRRRGIRADGAVSRRLDKWRWP